VTKQGGQGLLGKIEQWTIGVTRYYQCVMNDDFKHQCIQFLVGEHPLFQKPFYGVRASIAKELLKNNRLYTKQSDIKVAVLTWNCAGNPPPSQHFDVRDVLLERE